MPNSYKFLDVRVDDVTMDQTVDAVTAAITNKQALNIVTLNPELVMTAAKNKAFKDIVAKADVVTPDGIGLIIMGRLTGRRLHERVTGVDLCDRLAQEASKNNWGIYLLGATPGVAQQAATNLQKAYPGLTISGTSSADPDDQSANDIKNDIISVKPDILLVAYGSPVQELWIQKHRGHFDPIVTIGVGGSFDFIAGSAKRAPKLVQKIGLEWLWRLVLQPWRIKRIAVLPKFAILSLFK